MARLEDPLSPGDECVCVCVSSLFYHSDCYAHLSNEKQNKFQLCFKLCVVDFIMDHRVTMG